MNSNPVRQSFTSTLQLCVVTQRSSPRNDENNGCDHAGNDLCNATMSSVLRPKCHFHRIWAAAISYFDLTDAHTVGKRYVHFSVHQTMTGMKHNSNMYGILTSLGENCDTLSYELSDPFHAKVGCHKFEST